MKKVIDKSDSRGHSLYDWLDSHTVVVQYTQGAEIHPAGIVILVETEGVVAVKPII
jgi:hypothetical protein